MFFYGYCCYMKKHVIIDDIPNIPSDKKDEADLDEGVRQGDDSRVENRYAVTGYEDWDTYLRLLLSFFFFWSFKPFYCIDISLLTFFGCYKRT